MTIPPFITIDGRKISAGEPYPYPASEGRQQSGDPADFEHAGRRYEIVIHPVATA